MKLNKLSRRDLLKRAGVAGAALVTLPRFNRGHYRLFESSPTEYSSQSIELIGRTTVIDMLSVMTLDFDKEARWFKNPEIFTAADLQPYLDSNINVFHQSIGIGGPDAYENALQYFAHWNGFIANDVDHFRRIGSVADLKNVKKSGKIGILLGLPNSEHFRRPDDVDFFRGLGQRVSQLTYNSRNLIGNGSTERRDDGISDFGV